MTINGTEIYMTRGDNESITITVNGQELLEDDTAELTVRQTVRSEKVIHKIAKPNADMKSFTISIEPEDTHTLQFGNYIYDIQLTLSGAIRTVIRPSTFTIGEEVSYD